MATTSSGQLPRRALLDTSVVIRALGYFSDDTAKDCKAVWKKLTTENRTILIAAPTIAEILRKDSKRALPRVRGIIVVGFDDAAAEILGKKFPIDTLKETATATGLKLTYLKYDALIVACAIRHRADCLVTVDGNQVTLSKHVGVKAMRPHELQDTQPSLFDNLPMGTSYAGLPSGSAPRPVAPKSLASAAPDDDDDD